MQNKADNVDSINRIKGWKLLSVIAMAMASLLATPVDAKQADPAKAATDSKVESGKPASSSWTDKVTIGGELRLRSESQLQYGPITGGEDDDSFVLLRARFHLDVKPVDGVRIFIQPQFSRAFAQEESTVANNGDATNPNNVFDLHQGYVDFDKINGSIVSVRLGRQELSYGDQRLIGGFNWSNIGRSFDAAKVRFGWEKVWVDGFFGWDERIGGSEYFSGLYSSWKVNDSFTTEPYALVLWDADGDTSATVTSTKLVTIGDRIAGTALDKKLDYNAEAALQLGKTNPQDHLAYAFHGAVGYTFARDWKPRLGVEYNLASGDNPTSAKQTRFNNLFPTNHDKYGFIDFVSWRNIHDIVASASVKPSEKSFIGLDYHLFLLPHPEDALYRASGAVLRTGAAGASRLAGHEIDLLAKYQCNKWVGLLAGYSLFHGGSFFSDTGTNGTAHFAYGQVTTSF